MTRIRSTFGSVCCSSTYRSRGHALIREVAASGSNVLKSMSICFSIIRVRLEVKRTSAGLIFNLDYAMEVSSCKLGEVMCYVLVMVSFVSATSIRIIKG